MPQRVKLQRDSASNSSRAGSKALKWVISFSHLPTRRCGLGAWRGVWVEMQIGLKDFQGERLSKELLAVESPYADVALLSSKVTDCAAACPVRARACMLMSPVYAVCHCAYISAPVGVPLPLRTFPL